MTGPAHPTNNPVDLLGGVQDVLVDLIGITARIRNSGTVLDSATEPDPTSVTAALRDLERASADLQVTAQRLARQTRHTIRALGPDRIG